MSSRKGGTTPPSIRSLRTSRVRKSTSVGNSWARGPPRSNVSGMRKSHLASAFVGIRASCRLRTSCRVVSDCCSLSSVNSRQRASALHSSVRLRLVYILLAFSSPELSSTPLTLRSRQIFRGLAERRDIPLRYRYRERLASGVPSGPFVSGLYAPVTSASMGTQSLSSSAPCLRYS